MIEYIPIDVPEGYKFWKIIYNYACFVSGCGEEKNIKLPYKIGENDCPECGGEGWVYQGDKYGNLKDVLCPECKDGKIEVLAISVVQCGECGGSGKKKIILGTNQNEFYLSHGGTADVLPSIGHKTIECPSCKDKTKYQFKVERGKNG